MKKIVTYSLLVFISLATLLLALPTINDNIDKPNLIPYFNSDEGGLMDLMWSYYSGEKRNSFQWDADYGLEMVYLAGFSRLFLSSFMRITPGTLILMLRWLHLAAWIASFFVLFRLVIRHFASTWQAILVVVLLAVRPAFAYLQNTAKPEPLVLLLMLLGLDYSLRIVEGFRAYRYLLIATSCAALAVLIKYAGVFLLPAIVLTMFFANRYQKAARNKAPIFPDIKISWVFPAMIGLIIIVFPLLSVFTYVSKSLGTTWYEQSGLFGSLLHHRFILYMCVTGIFLMLLPLGLFFLSKSKNNFIKNINAFVNSLNSKALMVFGIFFIFFLIFGLKWIIDPGHFVNSYAQLWSTIGTKNIEILNSLTGSLGPVYGFAQNIINRITILDPIIFLLFLMYIIMEMCGIKRSIRLRKGGLTEKNEDLLKAYKRFILAGFLIPFWGCMVFSAIRMELHNILPFFVVMSILSVQGIDIFKNTFTKKKLVKNLFLILIGLFLTADIFINMYDTLELRMRDFRRGEDIAYEIGDWWIKNIPKDTKIVSDHYKYVYIPEGYDNVRTLGWSENIRDLHIAALVERYRPDLVYYNENASTGYGGAPLPIEQILPGMRVELIKSFEGISRNYARYPGARFVIYRILYEKN